VAVDVCAADGDWNADAAALREKVLTGGESRTMKHHKRISRPPLMASTPFEPGGTSLGSKLNFLIAMTERVIEFVFNVTGHNQL
jgi:hypothetical protein